MKELSSHYEMWNQDNEKRMHRTNGWNDVTDAYWGKLPNDWPYDTRIVDPRLRTTIIEKNARLINNKLRGRLVPREGGDMVSAALNNSVLDFQWDNANYGGSMFTKMSITEMDTRLYASKFGYVYWRYDVDEKGKCTFDGNEYMPLDIRDCGIDPTATHIRDAKWFQLRQWEKLEDLESAVDLNGKRLYKNLDKLRQRIETKLKNKTNAKRTEYTSRVKQLKGLEDRVGEDMAFPVVKTCTEFREDKWVKFVPDHDLILLENDNPYIHGKIPIVQLRYYPLQDDPHGESEAETVLPIWKAIQATICAYMDEVILKMRPPLKIVENQATIETIVYGPEAQWIVQNQDAVQEMQSAGEALKYFQTTYQTLISAFNVAMGDLSSQNVSNIDPFSSDEKTATEIKATVRQQNIRDQKNQNDLAEFIKDIMMMWLSNNKQFLFSDPDKREYVIKIVGKEKYSLFEQAGMHEMEMLPETAKAIADIIQMNPDVSDSELQQLQEIGSMPKYPIILNPNEKNPEKIKMKPKMVKADYGDSVDVSIVPKDLNGTYDYIPDVKSMEAGAGEMMSQSLQEALKLLTSSPSVIQLLAQDGYRPNVKELISSVFEQIGLRDTERLFSKIDYGQAQNPTQAMGGLPQNSQIPGVPGVPQAALGAGIPEQMAGPQSVGQAGTTPVPNV